MDKASSIPDMMFKTGLVNYRPGCQLPAVFVNKVLLTYSHIHLFLSYTVELSSCNRF